MKKRLSLLLAVLLAAVLTACGQKAPAETAAPAEVTEAATEAAEETTAAQETAEASSEAPLVNMPNPMLPITDSEEFDLTLNIPISASVITENAEMFIIGNNAAHIAWNEDANLTFRATKNAEMAEMLHGIYDEKMSDPETKTFEDGKGGKVDVTYQKAETEGFGIYSWNAEDTYYTLTADKDLSEEKETDLLDRCLYAAGLLDFSKTIEPLPIAFDPENLEDGIYHADFVIREPEGDGSFTFDFELYAEELFDVVDVHEMKEGDFLFQGDCDYEIESLTEENGAILVNGGLDEGGVTLLGGEGGTYYAQNYDDLPFLVDLGGTELTIASTVVLKDTSNPDDNFQEHDAKGAANCVDYMCNTDWIFISPTSTKIRVENKKIVEIIFNYVP